METPSTTPKLIELEVLEGGEKPLAAVPAERTLK